MRTALLLFIFSVASLAQTSVINGWGGPGGSSSSSTERIVFGFCAATTCNNDAVANLWQATVAGTISKCWITAGTAPSGSGESVQIVKNGATNLISSAIALSSGQAGIAPSLISSTSFNSGANVLAVGDTLSATLTGTTGEGVTVTCSKQ